MNEFRLLSTGMQGRGWLYNLMKVPERVTCLKKLYIRIRKEKTAVKLSFAPHHYMLIFVRRRSALVWLQNQIMQAIIQTLEARKKDLKQSALCKMIGDESITATSRLAFTPAMLFFVMGFKDILNEMKDDQSTDPMQQSVNVHCEEDSFHWQWYLKDLERISFGKEFLHIPPTELFTLVWSESWAATREVVYKSIHLAKQYNTPFYKLVLIEALEATFDCFNEPLFKLVHAMGRQDELEYFGVLHAHAEADHAMEKTSDEQESSSYNNYQPSSYENSNAVMIIDEVFNAFANAFDTWYQQGITKSVKQQPATI